jgi:integrase
MAQAINKLTPREVATKKEPGTYSDGNNLYLQIGPSGGKSWLFRYMFSGKAKNLGLGAVNTFTLLEARQAATAARKLLHQGIDPRIARDAAKAANKAANKGGKTFREAAGECITAKTPEWKNAKHAAQWTATLETYAYPIIGQMQVKDIGIHDVLKVLNPIWATKTETASRVRMRIEAVLNYCKELRDGAENPAIWKGNLDAKLSKPNKVKKVQSRPALPFSRMYEFMTEMRKQEGIGSAALEFQIYCASRPGEVRFAKWSEVDLENAVWIIPAARMKAEKEHEVPLCRAALDLLKGLSRFEDCDFVFTADGKKPISENTSNEVIKRMNGEAPTWVDPRQGKAPAVAHGFRSSFRDWAGEVSTFPKETIEHALAHQLKNKSEASYARGTLFNKRRKMMESWATFCNSPAKQATVTPIKG